jgi:hypothetical protein
MNGTEQKTKAGAGEQAGEQEAVFGVQFAGGPHSLET